MKGELAVMIAGGLTLSILLQGIAPGPSVAASQLACRVTETDSWTFDARKSGVNVVRDLDYGSFRWLVLDRRGLEKLAASGVECEPEPKATEIHIGGQTFDPLVDKVETAESLSAKLSSAAGWWIIQFVGPVTDDWLWWLRRAGMDPVQYLPVNAYLVWWDGSNKSDGHHLVAAPFLRWAGPLTSDLKRRAPTKSPANVVNRYEALVYGRHGVEPALRRMEAVGCRLTSHFKAQPDGRLWTVLFEARPEEADAAAELTETVWIGQALEGPGLAGEMSSVVNAGGIETGRPMPGYRETLEDFGVDGSGVIWAVVDSGVDRQHPDLDIVEGINGPGCETQIPGDDLSVMKHGTPVAGLLSGSAATGRADPEGFLYGLGVAPGARLVVHNGICGLGPWPPEEGWESLTRSILEAGAVGMNASWFSGTAEQQGYESSARAMDILVRDGNFETEGVPDPCMMVFAAGNSGPESTTLRPPNHAKNIITVGAIHNWRSAGDAETMTGFSSRGPTSDGRIAPTLVAPGEAVTTTAHRDGGIIGDMGAIDGTDGLYTMFEGTSAAAPHVSGSLAVITQWWRKHHRGLNPSPAMAKALLVNGAVGLRGTAPVPNMDEGWGRVDLGRVLDPGTSMMYVDQTALLRESGDIWHADVEVADPSQPLKVTLAWTDAPALPEADPALVNDLDLLVETGGRDFLGNVFDQGWSVEGGTRDSLNNLENVFVAQPGDRVRIRIQAAHIPGDGVPFNGGLTDQDFALVCRNCVAPASPGRHASRRVAPAGPAPIQVNVDARGLNITGDAANEPSLAVDVDDPSHLVMAWRQFDAVTSEHRTAGWATSVDGGCSWHVGGAIGGEVFRSDPVLAALGGGRFAYVGLGDGFESVDVFLSDDGGTSWVEGGPAFGGDKPGMAADAGRDALYISWDDTPSCCGRRTFSRSLDGGRNFEQPVEVPKIPVLGTVATGIDGEVYMAGLLEDFSIGVARADHPYDPDRPLEFELATVDLGGDFPFTEPPNPGGLSTQAWIAVDRSHGPFRGSAYLLAAVDPAGPDPLDVVVARSDDRGLTWTEPVQVFRDYRSTWQWFPTLSVAPNGRVDVAFVNTPDPEVPEVNEIRVTSSYDGGLKWFPAKVVTSEFDTSVGWPVGQMKIGDYFQLVSLAEGAYLAFSATFNGEQDVYLLRLGMPPCENTAVVMSDGLESGDCSGWSAEVGTSGGGKSHPSQSLIGTVSAVP
jgi:hypothetical protein